MVLEKDDSCPTAQPVDANVMMYYDNRTNGKGQRTSMLSASGFTWWTYDARGRMLSETIKPDGINMATFWTYNSANLPNTVKYPDDEIVTYGYNSRMLLDSLTGTSIYVSSTTYDSAGRIDLRTFGTTTTTQTDYIYYPWTQQGGRLQFIKSGTSSSPTSLQNLEYAYDAVGNVDWIKDWKAGSPQLLDFGYDGLNRLTTASATGGTDGLYNETYTYNTTTGNLENKAGVTLAYGDAAHVHAATSAGSNAYTYDANGNQKKRVIGGQTFTLEYDAENQLVKVCQDTSSNGVCDTGETVTAQFTYDGDGRQVKAVLGSTTTYYAGAHYEQTGTGTVTKYYFAGAQRVAMRTGSTLTYLLGDHLGSTSLTINTSGALVAELRYKPWGETRYTSGTTSTNYQYTGQRNEVSLGLYFYNARWYDSYLNHFTQPDSIVPDPNNPQAWDKYAYALNNPIRYNDPSGHMADPGEGGGSRPRVRVFYLNGLGGEHNNKLTPVMDEENEYNSSMYWIAQAVGEENLIHVPLFTNPYVRGPAQLEMYGEALGLSNNWTNKALDAIRSELENNPLGEDEKLVIVGSSAGGTVGAELLDDLASDGIFVDQLILRGSPVIELNLTNVGEVDYIASENPVLEDFDHYSVDVNPFDAVQVQEYRIPGLHDHVPHGFDQMNKIGSLIVDLIMK